jgi:hypothetical protein
VVRELLTPFKAETWASQRGDLPRYAEAAPDQFLDILESDLDSDDPKILALLKPASSQLFGGGCPRQPQIPIQIVDAPNSGERGTEKSGSRNDHPIISRDWVAIAH